MSDLGPFSTYDRPPCWVLDRGVWCRGRIHQWFRRDNGWSAVVSFTGADGLGYYQDVEGERLADGNGPAPHEQRDIQPPWEETAPPWE